MGRRPVRLKGSGKNTNDWMQDPFRAVYSPRAGGRTQTLQVLTGRSYLSDSERVLTFGLGTAARVEELEVRWPGGARQKVPVEGIDRRVVVSEG